MAKFPLPLILPFFLSVGFGQDVAPKGPEDHLPARINGALDHVLATLPTARFEAIQKLFSEKFKASWVPEESSIKGTLVKGFVMPGAGGTYAELWNAGIFHLAGYQTGITCDDENARDAVKRHFGVSGVTEEKIFTAGMEGAAGNPLGGTFYVSYGGIKGNPIAPSDKRPILDLKELVTAALGQRISSLRADYEFYGFTVRSTADGFTATDHKGFVVRVVEVPAVSYLTSLGHVALHFHLRDPHEGREEIKLDDESRAIFEGRDFFLILQTEVFKSLKPL